MAKKKNTNKTRYRKGGPARLDMRKGGRVALQEGGGKKKTKEIEEYIPPEKSKTGDPTKPDPTKPKHWYPGKLIGEVLKDDPSDPKDWYLGKNIQERREGRKTAVDRPTQTTGTSSDRNTTVDRPAQTQTGDTTVDRSTQTTSPTADRAGRAVTGVTETAKTGATETKKSG